MFRTTLGVLAFTFVASTLPSNAAESAPHEAASATNLSGAVPSDASAGPTLSPSHERDVVDWSLVPAHFGRPRRGGILPALYISLAGLNAFDAYSTSKGLSRGATEANPLMRTFAGNPTMVWIVKAGATGASVAMAERLWRKNKRAQAVAVMVISNGMMVAVAARNAGVLRTRQ